MAKGWPTPGILFYVRKRFAGIGNTKSKEILAKLGINGHVSLKKLSKEGRSGLDQILDIYCSKKIDATAIRWEAITRLNRLGLRRGKRHMLGLPIRGQRTHTNARTRKRRRVF